MTAIGRIIRAPRPRRNREERAPRRRSGIALEHLDHRPLTSVNFTGNVVTDFPATTSPGAGTLRLDPLGPNFRTPIVPVEEGIRPPIGSTR